MAKSNYLSLTSLIVCYHLVMNRLLGLEDVRRHGCSDEDDLNSLSSCIKFYQSILDELECLINNF